MFRCRRAARDEERRGRDAGAGRHSGVRSRHAGDGNGRTARLLELAILLEAGLPQPTCHLLSNHYNQARPAYYRQLDRASKAQNGPYGFIAYALTGFVDGLQDQKRLIREHQWQVAWVHFVHESFSPCA